MSKEEQSRHIELLAGLIYTKKFLSISEALETAKRIIACNRPLEFPEVERDIKQQRYLKLIGAIKDQELSIRSLNGLQNANIEFVFELVQQTKQQLLKIHNLGYKSVNELEDYVINAGLQLETKFSPEMIEQLRKDALKLVAENAKS